jgi:hypothetical protein
MSDGLEKLRKYNLDLGSKPVPADLREQIYYLVESFGTDLDGLANYINRITKNQYIHTSRGIAEFPDSRYMKALHNFYVRKPNQDVPAISSEAFKPEDWVQRWKYLNEENFIPGLEPEQLGLEYYGRRDEEKKGLCPDYQNLKPHEKLGVQCMVVSDACVQNLRLAGIPARLRVGALKFDKVRGSEPYVRYGHHFVHEWLIDGMWKMTDASDNWKWIKYKPRSEAEGRTLKVEFLKTNQVKPTPENIGSFRTGSGKADGWMIPAAMVVDDVACLMKTPRLRAWEDPISFRGVKVSKVAEPEVRSQDYYRELYSDKLRHQFYWLDEVENRIDTLVGKLRRRRIDKEAFMQEADVLYGQEVDELERLRKMDVIKIG